LPAWGDLLDVHAQAGEAAVSLAVSILYGQRDRRRRACALLVRGFTDDPLLLLVLAEKDCVSANA
jgi:hypothetical protein